MSQSNKITILQYNYWEHFKAAKDLGLVLPIDHPRRKQVEDSMNKISRELNELKNKENKIQD